MIRLQALCCQIQPYERRSVVRSWIKCTFEPHQRPKRSKYHTWKHGLTPTCAVYMYIYAYILSILKNKISKYIFLHTHVQCEPSSLCLHRCHRFPISWIWMRKPGKEQCLLGWIAWKVFFSQSSALFLLIQLSMILSEMKMLFRAQAKLWLATAAGGNGFDTLFDQIRLIQTYIKYRINFQTLRSSHQYIVRKAL